MLGLCWGTCVSVWVCVLTCAAHGCMVVRGRKSYWWIIAPHLWGLTPLLPFDSASLYLPHNPLSLLFSRLLPSVLPAQHMHTHWKTHSDSSCLVNLTCELLGWNVRGHSTYLTKHACQSEGLPRQLWLWKRGGSRLAKFWLCVVDGSLTFQCGEKACTYCSNKWLLRGKKRPNAVKCTVSFVLFWLPFISLWETFQNASVDTTQEETAVLVRCAKGQREKANDNTFVSGITCSLSQIGWQWPKRKICQHH